MITDGKYIHSFLIWINNNGTVFLGWLEPIKAIQQSVQHVRTSNSGSRQPGELSRKG